MFKEFPAVLCERYKRYITKLSDHHQTNKAVKYRRERRLSSLCHHIRYQHSSLTWPAFGFILVLLNETLSLCLSDLPTFQLLIADIYICLSFVMKPHIFIHLKVKSPVKMNKDKFVLLNMENVFWPLFIDTL